MGKALKTVLDNGPEYFLGLQNLGKDKHKDNSEFKRLSSKNKWCSSELLHRASIKGELNSFFEALQNKKILIVANKAVSNIKEVNATKIIIPVENCWLKYKEILDDIQKYIQTNEDAIVLYSASMMANVLIDVIYNQYGKTITQIDTGSVFDPYIGVQSRSYHKNLKI